MKITGYQTMNASFFGTGMFGNTRQTKSEHRGNSNLPGDRDTVTISLFGQNGSSRIKNLMEQKQSLLERKNQWVNYALENDQDLTSIHDMLDSYEEQLNELEQQISQEMAKQNSGQPEKAPSSKKNDEPKTKQEIEQERISNLVDLSSGMSQVRAVQSSQTQIEGEARVLESEIKMDKGRTGDTEIIAKKEEKLAQLQQKAAELTANVVKISGEINEKISETDDFKVQEASNEEQRKKNNPIIRDLTGEYKRAEPDCRDTIYEQKESES